MKLCFATFQTISLLFLGLFAFASTPNQLTEEEKAAGWKLLFNGNNVEGWRSFKKPAPPGKGWAVEDSWLHGLGKSGGDIITDKEFTDFELEWEWKLSPKGNSGVKYFVTETRDSALGHEYQMIDEEGEPDAKQARGKRVTASFYDVLKLDRVAPTKPIGEINHSRIVVQGNRVEHWLNGAKVLEYSVQPLESVTAGVIKEILRGVPGQLVQGVELRQ